MTDNGLVLIRLLKDGHISEAEFMSLYEVIERAIVPPLNFEMPTVMRGPDIWHGINHPTTGEPLGPTYCEPTT